MYLVYANYQQPTLLVAPRPLKCMRHEQMCIRPNYRPPVCTRVCVSPTVTELQHTGSYFVLLMRMQLLDNELKIM